MGHNHGAEGHSHDSGNTSSLKIAFLLNFSFTLIELVGGLWTNSVAILSDAVHDLGDTLSLGLAWYFSHLSKRESNTAHTYGYKRYSLLGGLITALVLIMGLSFVLWHAVGRLFAPEPVNAQGMILIAILGVIFNGAAVLRVRKGTSLTEGMVSWHLLEDTLGWMAVLIGAGIMAIWNVPIVDPLLSIGISLFVLFNVIRNIRKFLDVFLQKTPLGFNVTAFENQLLAISKVVSVHHTHIWSIDGESHVLTTHLVMRKNTSREEILGAKENVRHMLDAEAFEHVTVDIELEDEKCVTEGHNHKTGS